MIWLIKTTFLPDLCQLRYHRVLFRDLATCITFWFCCSNRTYLFHLHWHAYPHSHGLLWHGGTSFPWSPANTCNFTVTSKIHVFILNMNLGFHVNSVLILVLFWMWHSMEVGYIADIQEKYATSTHRIKVNKVGVGVVSARPWPFYPRERPGTHCTGGWVAPRTGLDGCGKSRPHQDSIPDRPARSASLYWLSSPDPLGTI